MRCSERSPSRNCGGGRGSSRAGCGWSPWSGHDEARAHGRVPLSAVRRGGVSARPQVRAISAGVRVGADRRGAAAAVARETRIPLVVDFHNEWTRNMYYRPSTRWHDRAHHRLEREVIESARAVTTLNPMHTEDLITRFPRTRIETIENGCDLDD